jgi:uncharacterized protein (DUF58 family)
MLTRRGWVLVVLATVLMVAGVLIRVVELLPIAVAAFTLLAVSAFWVVLRRWNVIADRRVATPRVALGAVARIELSVRNLDHRRSPPLFAQDGFDGGGRVALFSVAPLAPGELRQATYRLNTTQRGVFNLGPLELALHDPFGMVRAVHQAAGISQLVVHPVIEPLTSLPPSGLSDEAGTGTAGLVGHRNDEFFALREYRTGDDLRRVHWASSARTDDLMIRSDQAAWQGRLIVIADLREEVHDRESLEAGLSAAASIADAAFHAGTPVRLLTTGGADSGEGSSSAHRGLILDLLGGAGPVSAADGRHESANRLSDRLGSTAYTVRDASVVVVTTNAVADLDLLDLRRFTAAGCGMTVVLIERRRFGDPESFSPAAHRPVPGRVVVVPPGASFPQAWNRAMRAGRAEHAGT